MTNQELYNDYQDNKLTDALRADRLKTLRQRAGYGNRDAQFYVDKIERCSKQPFAHY